ncbi:RHS repeat protein [Pontibacter sp. KCTC 32443]|uniref:RHS repeat domain-containing protein n=1 Tax=Pontibacter TaxID=323449 RepID=UPI00164E5DD8|nr:MULTISPECIES: RHS repeat domain-containing protein [Pontibacter]MBC5774750.1 RHS repeat protein [Pontibacter sp. KCTC 32443]
MRINLLYLLALFLCLTSCLELGSDDAEPKEDCRLASSTTTVKNSEGSVFSYKLNYTYNEDGRLASIAAPDTNSLNIRFTYDAQGRLISERLDQTTWTSEYNALDQVVKQTHTFEFAPGRYEVYYLVHQYNNTGLLEETRHYLPNEEGDVLGYTFRYSYSNGKMSGVEKISGYSLSHHKATFVTDDKKVPTPTQAMHMLYLFRDETLPMMGLLTGNLTSFNVTEGEFQAGFKSFNASITYNDAGYPTAVTREYANGATENSTYTYSCE